MFKRHRFILSVNNEDQVKISLLQIQKIKLKKYLDIVKKIHASPYKLTLVSSGGGTNAISELLKVPGASKTILESYIPYSKK